MTTDKRVRTAICPICDGTVLAPESLEHHVKMDHKVFEAALKLEEARAQVAALREALSHTPWRWERNEGHRCGECGHLYPDHNGGCKIAAVLNDTAQAAQDHDRQVVEPWRKALTWALNTLDETAEAAHMVTWEDEPTYQRGRALLASGEPVEPPVIGEDGTVWDLTEDEVAAIPRANTKPTASGEPVEGGRK